MKIRKNDNGNIREFEIKEFIEKMVTKKAIKKVDKMYYRDNPQKLCKELNKNEHRFGVRYYVVQFEFKRLKEMKKYIGHKTQGEILRSFYFENIKKCGII